MGRMERKAALVEGRYDRLPPQLRERFGRAVVAAVENLAMVEEIKEFDPGLGDEAMDLVLMAFSTGKIAGSWTKVHTELASGSPRLYRLIGSRLPRDEG